MKLTIVKRAGALASLALILGAFLGPIVATADGWYGQFVRDPNYYLDVNCKVGCGGGSGSTTTSIVDKTSASPAPVSSLGDSVQGPALSTYARNQLYNAGALAYDRQQECAWSSSERNGVACVAGNSVDYTLASAVVATANQSWTQQMPAGAAATSGGPARIELCMSASGATTFTVSQSVDRGTNYYNATIDGTATSANFVPTGAGSICERLGPSNAIKVATSAAVTVTIQAQANY